MVKRIVLAVLLLLAAAPLLASISVTVADDGSITATVIGEDNNARSAWCAVGREAERQGWEQMLATLDAAPLNGVRLTARAAGPSDDGHYLTSELLEKCDD